jgi:hypothetical protein
MSPEDLTRRDTLEEQIESIRNMRRRDQALLRSPVTAPAGFSKKELRRQCLETKEEFLQRR